VGALNYLGSREALAGVAEVRQGKTFTLQVQIGNPKGDPTFPGPRGPARRVNIMDRGVYLGGAGPEVEGDAQFADDMIIMYLQGSSQYDALGHLWCGDQIYNGYPAETTTGGMKKASILPIAEKGVVGRGVLIDMARYRGKRWPPSRVSRSVSATSCWSTPDGSNTSTTPLERSFTTTSTSRA
jgi:hypothetical protein